MRHSMFRRIEASMNPEFYAWELSVSYLKNQVQYSGCTGRLFLCNVCVINQIFKTQFYWRKASHVFNLCPKIQTPVGPSVHGQEIPFVAPDNRKRGEKSDPRETVGKNISLLPRTTWKPPLSSTIAKGDNPTEKVLLSGKQMGGWSLFRFIKHVRLSISGRIQNDLPP